MGNYVTDHSAIEEKLSGRAGLSDFSASTRPSDTDVDDYIDMIEGEIDGVLIAQGYETVPADHASDVKMLARYVRDKVAAMVWRDVYSEDDAPSHIKRWEEDYAEFLARLRRGEQTLRGQQPKSENDPVFFIVRHPERDRYFTERHDRRDWDES